MAKLSDRILKVIRPMVNSDEQLLVIGQLQSGPLGFKSSFILFGIFSFFMNKYWYAGITNKRIILILLNALSKPDLISIYSIPLTDIRINGKEIGVLFPYKPEPVKFRLHCGAKSFTGLDGEEFISSLKKLL
jgi:hypothetical protein